MKLIIAEKKDLARDIAKAIPGEIKENNLHFQVGDYIICWVGGHILKLKDPEEIDEKYKRWDSKTLPIYFSNWEKKVDSNKKGMFENIKKLVKEAEIIINAGDPDDEGQYLIDEVIEYLKCKKKVLRLLVSDNSLEAVKKALANMKDNNNYLSLGYSAKARAIADATLGMSLTRYYTLKKKKNDYKGDVFSVGRVQTPTLALVVNRDYEIENHIKEKYYELFLNLPLESNRTINLKYNSEKILDRSILEKVKNDIENKNGKIKITKNIKLESPPLPFNLNKLQSEANNKFGYSTDEVMDITQILRDKYKAITYNRSDCQFLTNEIFKEAPKLVPNLLEKLRINIDVDLSEKNKSKAFKDEVLVHYGIIPTYNPDLKIENLNEKEKNIYLLIAQRYLIQFMAKAEIEISSLEVDIENKVFKKSYSKIIKKGYRNFYLAKDSEDQKMDDGIEESSLNFPVGEFDIETDKNMLEIIEKETKAKSRYTQATLISDMNNIAKYVKNEDIKKILKEKDKDKVGINGSIGTSATQSSIIKGLFQKGYLEEKKNKVYSTQKAKDFLKELPESLKQPDSTAIWWVIQEEIKLGNACIEDLTLRVKEEVENIINEK